MSERQIDDAIDAAVRDLMNVDADPAFRARVTARLHTRKAPVHFWRPLVVVSATAAVIAVAAGLSLMNRETRTLPGQSVTATSASAGASTPPSAAAQRQAAVETPPTRRRTVPQSPAPMVTRNIPRGGIVATVAGDDEVMGADETETGEADPARPLPSILPIEITSIAPAPIRPSEIVVAPLTPLSELAVAPLDPRNQRD